MGKLQGIDADIETSLKEYGFAWEPGETDTKFLYGINADLINEEMEYTQFDWGFFDNDFDFPEEFDWVNFEVVAEWFDMKLSEWEKLPMPFKIYDLVQYYGYENIFGSSYYEGLTYEEIMRKRSHGSK